MNRLLLTTRRFLPLFITQFLGAVNVNLLRNAVVMVALFSAGERGPTLVAVIGGIIMLPNIIFGALAGQLADRFEKSRLIRIAKLLEIALMATAAVGFLSRDLALLMAVVFGIGTQSTLFSPLKFGILPTHLAEPEMVAGNGLIETGTFVGILLGTIIGGALIASPRGPTLVGAACVAIALAGFASALAIPIAPATAPDLRIGWDLPRQTAIILRHARARRGVWLSILGISWSWTVGLLLLSELPVIATNTLRGNTGLATVLLAVFTVGIGVGSVLCARLLHDEVSPRHVPFAALGISLFTWDLANAALAAGALDRGSGVAALLASFAGWRIMVDLFLLAFCGGVFVVPLQAIVQARSPPALRARILAANNVLNAALMVVGAALAAVLIRWFSAPQILWIVAAANFVVALWILRILPQETMRALFRWYFTVFHGVKIEGLANYRAAGDRAVIIVNHQSFADGVFLGAFVPDEPSFAVYAGLVRKWWARLFLAPIDVFLVETNNPFSVKAMVAAVRSGGKIVIFPEGRITRTGSLMKIYEGAAMVADKANVPVVPIHIDGLQFTPLSRMHGKLRLRWFPPLSMTVLPPVRLAAPAALAGRARRRRLGTALQDVMVNADFATRPLGESLFHALLEARARYGSGVEIIEDVARTPLSYRGLLLAAAVLGRRLTAMVPEGQRIGLLLPNANATVVALVALQAFGRVPAMLNFTVGASGMLSACTAAEVKVVVSSRDFVERGRLTEAVRRMESEVRVIWLEDLRRTIGWRDRLRGLYDAHWPGRLAGARVSPDAPAVVLFTSGSEGAPKGVVLSHRNLLANCAQLSTVVDFNPSDRTLNAMPMFHSFGLTGGTILPLLSGVRNFLYPSPVHYRVVPELAYDTDATIVFGTDTFLAGWARYAHPYDFRSVRYAFAGAERVREETRRLYADRFGVRILEGYGITETAPVLALNTAMNNRPGTVGRLLPGVEYRLEALAGIAEGGRLFVRGPNIMLGYLRVSRPGVLEPPPEGWFDTGDIVAVDADGFVTIVGRVKRFAKIGGEMVSMAAVEALAAAVWPGVAHAVVSIPDARKGERMVLVSTGTQTSLAALRAHARATGVAEIMLPDALLPIRDMPLLGSGKTDYPAVQRLVAAMNAEEATVYSPAGR